MSNLPGLPQTSLSPAPHAAPSCSQMYIKQYPKLYMSDVFTKKNFITPVSVSIVFFGGGGGAVGFFFSSFSLLFSYDWMTIFSPALELLFLLCVYIYDINRFLVCRNHETLIQQSTYTCMIALSC